MIIRNGQVVLQENVTNTVENGNMFPVTSNAVNDKVSTINNSLNGKLPKTKSTTSATTQFTINGKEMNYVLFGADGSNQYAVMVYLYGTTICKKVLSGNSLPSNITFSVSGNNIIISVPSYWLVSIY